MRFTFVFLFLSLALNAKAAPTQGREGNGGLGVVFNDHVLLLDLYENQVSKPEYFKQPSSALYTQVKNHLPAGMPTYKIAQKLADTAEINGAFPILLGRALSEIQWSFESNIPSSIDNRTKIALPPQASLKQLAFRHQNKVFIQAQLWTRMDEDQKTALIIHEIVYFYLDPMSANRVNDPTKEFVATIFSSEKLYGMKGYVRVMWHSIFGAFPY